jgi:Sec-independent protein secretion pathway component TatC
LLARLTCSLPIVIIEIFGFVSPAFYQIKRKQETGDTNVASKADDVIITIFGAVITPNGSGVTMWFVILPMIALYAFGIIAIRRKEMSVIIR